MQNFIVLTLLCLKGDNRADENTGHGTEHRHFYLILDIFQQSGNKLS